MFSYAAKHVSRGRSFFIPLLIGVTLAVTLFSSILQGADTVSLAMFDKVMKATDVDIILSAENRNITQLSARIVQETIKRNKQVRDVDYLLIFEAEVNTTKEEAPSLWEIVAITESSGFWEDISGIGKPEQGNVYIDSSSTNASNFFKGQVITLGIETYYPYSPFASFEMRYSQLVVGGLVKPNERFFSIAMQQYEVFARSAILESILIPQSNRRLIIVSEETLKQVLEPIYNELRRPVNLVMSDLIIRLDRKNLVKAWDIEGSLQAARLVNEQINTIGARFMYTPMNYLEQLLSAIEVNISTLKINTTLTAIPAFFVAWYLSLVVSEISLSRRRREIGLLLTRGLTHRQVFKALLLEAILTGVFAGVIGVLASLALIQVLIPDLGFQQVFGSISPVTVFLSFVFSTVVSVTAIYKPARDASQMNLIDALQEYRSEEEVRKGSWQEPLLALLLGGYRIVTLLLGVSIESFRPTTENLTVFLLYSTWWGVDYILAYIGPILFFWGFTKLLIQHSTSLHTWLSKLTGRFAEGIGYLSAVSTERNVRRTFVSIFMVAIIFSFAISRAPIGLIRYFLKLHPPS